MWLRDSSAQVQPYIHLVAKDPKLKRLFQGLLQRQARCILIDPYANAFDKDPTAPSQLEWSQTDKPEMKPGVAERKWEIASLCYRSEERRVGQESGSTCRARGVPEH